MCTFKTELATASLAQELHLDQCYDQGARNWMTYMCPCKLFSISCSKVNFNASLLEILTDWGANVFSSGSVGSVTSI